MIPLILSLLLTLPVNMEIYPEKKKVFLGEKTRVSIEFPNLKKGKIKGVEIKSPDIHVFEKKIGKTSAIVSLGVYKLGKVDIPVKLFLEYEGKNIEKEFPGFYLTVESKVPDNAQIKSEKGVIPIINYPFVVVMILVLLLLITAFYLKKRKKPGIPEISITPEEWAKAELENILAEDYISMGQVKEYYDSISDCVRGYIDRKFQIGALESTLKELTSKLGERFNSSIMNEYRNFFEECDYIKFAPEGKEPDNIESIWERASRMVSGEF